MKTAISIPEQLNDSIEIFLKASKLSRSEFFQRAAKLYLRKVSAKAVTASLDRVYAADENPVDALFQRAALAHLAEMLAREDR